jgi:hypothetical protein
LFGDPVLTVSALADEGFDVHGDGLKHSPAPVNILLLTSHPRARNVSSPLGIGPCGMGFRKGPSARHLGGTAPSGVTLEGGE